MNQEQLTVGGFALIMLVIGGGVVYNWGYGSGLDQTSVNTSAAVVGSMPTPPPPPPPPAFPGDGSSIAPSITSISPTKGKAGAQVTLTGENFTYVSNLILNGTLVSLTDETLKGTVSEKSITFTIPKSDSSSISIQVVNETGPSNTVVFTKN